MTSNAEQFNALLKASGKSVTKARLAVFGALLSQEPLSMHALVGKVREVGRASVYRVLGN